MDKNLKFIIAVCLITAFVFGGGLISYADTWETTLYQGLSPATFSLPTQIQFTQYDLTYLNNRNHGSLLFYHRDITSAGGQLPGATWRAEYALNCYVRFRVPESGIEVQAGVLDSSSQNVVPFVDVSGTKLIYDPDNVSLVPQPMYGNSSVFMFPNTLSEITVYVDNSRQIAFQVYPSTFDVDTQIADVSYGTLTTRVLIYWTGQSYGSGFVNDLQECIEAHPSWQSVGLGFLTAMGMLDNIGTAQTNAYRISDFINYVNVIFPDTYDDDILEHITIATDFQQAILNGTLDQWKAVQELKRREEVLAGLADGVINGVYEGEPIRDIDDVFLIINRYPISESVVPLVLNTFYDMSIISTLWIISMSAAVIGLVLVGIRRV